jgi:hypothetical protein
MKSVRLRSSFLRAALRNGMQPGGFTKLFLCPRPKTRAEHLPLRRAGQGQHAAEFKGNTLLNYCGIGTDFLDFTVDRNPYKHGRFTPGMRIPIHDVGAIDAARPDYILILPWNLQQEIVRQMRHAGEWGGKFVVPIPEVAVFDPREPQV